MSKLHMRRNVKAAIVAATVGGAILAGSQSASANTWFDSGEVFLYQSQCDSRGQHYVNEGEWISYDCPWNSYSGFYDLHGYSN